MRFYGIAMLIFLLNVSVLFVNELDIFYVTHQAQQDWFDDVNQPELSNEEYIQTSVSSTTTDFGFGDFVKGLWYFIKSLGLAIIGVPYVLVIFGLQPPYTYIFSLPVYLIYVVALAQFISNRGLKGMS